MQTKDYYEIEIVTLNHIIVYKLIFGRITLNHKIVYKLIFDRINLNPIIVYELIFDRNTLNRIKVKLATIVKGDPKDPFSIATTQRCREGRYSFPWIAPLNP